MSVEGVEP